jgi:hypothetical protein
MAWSVLDYKHPAIRVKNEVSGEIVSFDVNDDGSLYHGGTRFDLGDARRAAMGYLARLSRRQEMCDQPHI